MFSVADVVVVGADGVPAHRPCPHGAVVVSQSCDAAQPDRPLVQVSPVVHLSGDNAAQAHAGHRPRYAPLPGAGTHAFADLDVVTTLEKASISELVRTPALTTDPAVRRFAAAVSRKYGRFAFPDDVVRCLRPLEETLQSKAGRPESPIGKVLQQVYMLRVEVAGNWFEAPFDLTIVVVTTASALPFTDPATDLPDLPDGLRHDLWPTTKTAAQAAANIATYLAEATPTDADRYWAWQWLAQAWAQRCVDQRDKLGLHAAVRSVRGEVVTVQEYSLDRVGRSEMLDLDYLSEPLPRQGTP
ncbi:hypothetical protein [Phycicoccus ginsengisoli]